MPKKEALVKKKKIVSQKIAPPVVNPKLIRITCESAFYLPYQDIKPFQGNLKDLSTDNYEKLKKSILTLGFSEPCSVWNQDLNYWALNCHQRLRVIKQMVEREGYECPPLPVSWIYCENEKEAKQKVLALTSQYGEITRTGLHEFMVNADLSFTEIDTTFRFPEIDLKSFEVEFFKDPEVLPPGAGEEDEVPEIKESFVKPGDIWQLGAHRLMCGDSTSIDAVEKLMNGEKADMVFTDPPYGMNLDTDFSSMKGSKKALSKPIGTLNAKSAKKHSSVIGDDRDFDPGIIFGIFDYVKEIFLWGADYYCQHLPKNGSWVVWDKTGGHDSLMNAGFASNFELCWSKQKHKRDLARITWKGAMGRSGEVGGGTVHPTQKPITLAQWFFERWSKNKEDKIVDLFGGSGSTLIACEKTARKCFMMELDTHYCGVIIERWQKYTGKTAELLS